MRNFLIIFFITTCGIFSAQTKKYSLSIKTDDQNSMHGFSYWNQVQIKSKDTLISFPFNSKKNNLTDSLPAGEYYVFISSLFGQMTEKKIQLNKNTEVKFSLAKLNKKTSAKSFSSVLKDGQTMYILHNATGVLKCGKIGITRKGTKYLASYFADDNQKIIMETEISEASLKLLRQTEKEAPSKNKSTGCTVIETYSFWCNGKYFTINDGTCSWIAWSKLYKSFFQSMSQD